MSEVLAQRAIEASEEAASQPIRLKEAREAAGLHIAALAAALKVPVRKLEALEAGRYGELPDLTFARALASSACRQLRIDPAPILQQIPQLASPKLGSPGHALNAPFHPGHDEAPFNPLSWLSRPALLAAIALLLGALVIVFLPQAESPPSPTGSPELFQQPVPTTEAVPDQSPGLSTVATPAPVDNASIEASPATVASTGATAAADSPVTATPLEMPAGPRAASTDTALATEPDGLLRIAATGESWVEVTNGSGTVVAKRLMQSGEVIDFSAAPPYTVVLGKADAVQVTVRGNALDTASIARNNVARFEVK